MNVSFLRSSLPQKFLKRTTTSTAIVCDSKSSMTAGKRTAKAAHIQRSFCAASQRGRILCLEIEHEGDEASANLYYE